MQYLFSKDKQDKKKGILLEFLDLCGHGEGGKHQIKSLCLEKEGIEPGRV